MTETSVDKNDSGIADIFDGIESEGTGDYSAGSADSSSSADSNSIANKKITGSIAGIAGGNDFDKRIANQGGTGT